MASNSSRPTDIFRLNSPISSAMAANSFSASGRGSSVTVYTMSSIFCCSTAALRFCSVRTLDLLRFAGILPTDPLRQINVNQRLLCDAFNQILFDALITWNV